MQTALTVGLTHRITTLPSRSQQLAALSMLVIIINILYIDRYFQHTDWLILRAQIQHATETLSQLFLPHKHLLWLCGNSLFFAAYILILWRYAPPPKQVVKLLDAIAQSLAPNATNLNALPTKKLVSALEGLAFDAMEQAWLRIDLHHELDTARQMLQQFRAQQKTLLRSTTREMTEQYHAILGYANYLDERIVRHRGDIDMRYDFDDVCESGFNLKLIAGALDMLARDATPQSKPQPLAELMQHTLLALSSSLDRRTMKLSTIDVDTSVTATTDATIVNHVLWMMLLGTVRYTAAESTLRMTCRYNSARTHAEMSVIVDELAPGAMTPEEHIANYNQQMEHGASLMFAETIRTHANIQLAELLLQKINASISIITISSNACEIRLTLPV